MATESDYNSCKALKAKSPQDCEFCDKQFNDRFSSIVHNSSHIIIPLLKHQIYYCEICYVYFTSTNDFNNHMSVKHCPVVSHNNDIEYDIKVPEVKLEKLPQLDRDERFEVKEEIFDENKYDSSSEDETLLEMVKRETERQDIDELNDELNDMDYTDFINSRLKFEVDHEYGGLLNGFTTDYEVNIQYMWNNNKNKDTETNKGNVNLKSITNNIVYEDPVDEFEVDDAILSEAASKTDEVYESVHYSDLMNFGFFCCKYCYVYFSNRFSLIIHETTHMRIKNVRKQSLLCPQCHVYIAGNYRTVQKHEAAVHGTISPKKGELRTSDTSSLRCRKYKSHIKNYDPNEPLESSKKKTAKDLETVQEPVQLPIEKSDQMSVLEPVQKCNWIEKYRTIKVCDLCYSFFKNSFKKAYILKETSSYTTEWPCHECKNLFYKLKTVRTIIRIHKSQRTRGNARNSLTNEKRLKKIQSRLKMINKLSKFYHYLLLMCYLSRLLNMFNYIPICIAYSNIKYDFYFPPCKQNSTKYKLQTVWLLKA